MKRFLKFFFSLLLSAGLMISPVLQVVSYADVNDLMINTDSNALTTLELDDSDYAVMPMSSLGSVTNTVDYSKMFVFADWNYTNGNHAHRQNIRPDSDGFIRMTQMLPDTYISQLGFTLDPSSLPSPGKYLFSFDYASDFSFDISADNTFITKDYDNASTVRYDANFPIQFSSGDFYLSPISLQLPSLSEFTVYMSVSGNDLTNMGGYISINFTRYNGECEYVLGDPSTSSQDYQNDVSGSLSDLSSSVGEMSDEISGVTEAIQNLQGAMEPHYNNVLTQLHHITEQLHAFYDQIYNNIHLKEYALWQDIKTAIENIDLEVNVNLDKLKTSIDNMSQAVQNKLQSVTDTITGGYDNSGIQSDNNELSGVLDELDNAEQEVLDDVNGYIEGFEYPSFDGISSGIIGALSFFGGFLHSIFLGMGEFGLIITFSLTMIFVLIIVGYHRIRS